MPLLQGAVGAAWLALSVMGQTYSEGLTENGYRTSTPRPAAYHIGPPAPDCGAMAARYGAQRLWFGAISGSRIDQFWDRRYPHYAEGCFLSEGNCRTWLHENLSFMNGGNLLWMRCQPGVPGRAVY